MNKTGKKKIDFLRLLKGIGVIIIALVAMNYFLGSNIIDSAIKSFFTVIDSTRSKKIMDPTTYDLSNEELAWHAAHTYDWDCDEVVLRGEMSAAGYFSITCSNGKILRVYPRSYATPRITNKSRGNY